MSHGAVPQVRLEVVPSADLLERLPAVFGAPGLVSVTCLPHHGPERTVAASIELAAHGYRTVPHLAARSITSHDGLTGMLEQLQAAGIQDLFAVAGDRRSPAGPYAWSGQLLEAIKAFSPDMSVGIAGYPEGHPGLSADQLKHSLEAKAPLASCMVTQMCFSAKTIGQYFRTLRSSGIELPVWVGVPGPVSTKKLLTMGARLGVGRSLKLARGTGMARALWKRHDLLHYDSSQLIRDVHRELAGDPLFAGFNVYAFNDFHNLPGLLQGTPLALPTGTAPDPIFPART
ncbi:methylenetetrahydrofolate reductase [Arthrobacter sp. ZBG10]|uniref:methylenetetrahydrofolate reductase n=1 Tax=Arthrobacter sp. ZBG10 TaxID=1676590 RepID=UPI0006816AE3|nr:methylenetetrahydrofolate reductase [Arthrobacter sp. ZBG10]